MKTRNIVTFLFLMLFAGNVFSQLGIKAGVNMANEIHTFDNEAFATGFTSDNLNGCHAGLVYQLNPKRSGIGFDTGVLLSKKGGVFKFDNSGIRENFVRGYHEVNYIDVPLNLRLKLSFRGIISLFGTGGVYGSYALNGKTVLESDIATLPYEDSFDSFMDRIDYGLSFGGGLEFLNKFQIGVNWSKALQKRDTNKSILDIITTETGGAIPNLQAENTAGVFSVSLTYLF